MRFVDTIAKYIVDQNLELEHLTIVLPSERVKKYLVEALYHQYQRPFRAPKMVTIDFWVKSHSPETVIDPTRALLRLYEIHRERTTSDEDRSFEEFFTWGQTLLSDFNEIDRYLLNEKQVFRNLADIKEIENWSFGEQELTKSQKQFMAFWDRLPGYYQALNERLTEQGMCYSGKAFKFLANNINVLFEEDEQAHYLFAGFNALSKAELSIIRQLDQLGRGHVLIDTDEFYYNDSMHEAGRFLRDLSEELDQRRWDHVRNELSTKEMNVELISCAQKTGQAKVVATLLNNQTKEDLDDTLLLLADETLISAVIKNLPASIGKVNITLGMPIRNTAIRTWVDLLFSVQENKRRFRTSALYFQDIQNFWNHPFIQAALSKEEKALLSEAERIMIRRNSIFVNPKNLELGENARSFLEWVATPWGNDWKKAVSLVRKLSAQLYKGFGNGHAFEKAMLEAFDKAMLELENIVSEGIPEMTIRSFRQLFNMHWGKQSIAYHGNPLDGLQIMGLLETRALDFKNIICVGMNEGNLPPTNPIQTMIPMDLRRFLGLPTPREKQGLFAHHFYRLLHECENLFVTYNSADESIGSNEPSRYLLQLEMELSRLNPNVQVEKKVYSLETTESSEVQSISKSQEILDRMDELFAGSTSASMLKKYLSCPLDFYFRYVMDFGEADEVEEEIEHSTFGTFIHSTLEILYRPFARFDEDGNRVTPEPRAITPEDIDQMLGQFRKVLTEQFMEHFNGDKDAFMKGKNLLSYRMAQELTERFLKSEKDFLMRQEAPVYIEALEREYSKQVSIDVNGVPKMVRLRGFIDRIDRIGDRIRIVDYKSGKVSKDQVELRGGDQDLDTVSESLAKRKHVLQLMMYVYLYHAEHGVIPESSIISFVSENNRPFPLDTKRISFEEVVENFPLYVGRILESVYDTSQPFQHNAEQFISFCLYCE